MTAHHNRLKTATFTLNAVAYSCQITNWTINNETADGDRVFTYCVDGEFYDEADDTYTLGLKWVTDWTENGLNRYLIANAGSTTTFVVTNHPDIDGETVEWTGTVKLKAPTAGGDVRTLEVSEVTLPIVGKPVVSYPTES